MPVKPLAKLRPNVQPVRRGEQEPGQALEEAVPKPVLRAPVPAESERVLTGIPGLDELLGGGFERQSTNLVMGGAGCGKTTFVTQFLYNGATQYDEPGVILSFDESTDSVLRHMQKYGFDFKTLSEKNMFATINYRPHEVKKLIEEGGGLILDTISSLGAKRLVIDPITPYLMLFESGYQAREAQITFFELLKKWKCTTLLSAQGTFAKKTKASDGIEYLADSVILMHHPRSQTSRYRALEVVKMRGGKAIEKLCPFEIVDGLGIKIYPKETVFYDVGKGD